MKLPTNTVTSTGNLAYVKKTAMQIDPSASGIILDSLIRIYTNPYVAALREYLSNALDSHREAGQTRPVEVSLPTELSPMLIIEDWGTGMDSETLDQYGQFGWSTKRDSNDDIGGFGLGSKVGLALTAQYTVRSVKDGKLSLAVIGRDADGNPEMSFITVDEDTDLPNGVKITIPTSEHRQFAIDKDRFLVGFPVGAVLLDGRPNAVSVHDANKFTPIPNVGWRADRDLPTSLGGLALVHGVVYDLDFGNISEDFDYTLRRGLFQEVVLELENGEVDISRSRETLVYSKRTRELLTEKLNGMVEYLSIQYGKEVDAAATAREALQQTDKARGMGLDTSEYTWQGKPLLRPEVVSYYDSHSSANFTKVDRVWSGAARSKTRLVRSSTRYGFLASGSEFSRIYDRKVSTLIYKAATPVHQKNGEVVHVPEANALRLFAEMEHGPTDHGMSFYITSEKLKDLPVEFTQAFSQMLSAKDLLKQVADERETRRLAAAAERRAYAASRPKAPKSIDVEVRQFLLTGNAHGYGSTYSEDVEFAPNLDPNKTYVLVQRGISGVTSDILETISTRDGAYSNDSLYKTLLELQNNRSVSFLVLNAGRSIKSHQEQVPNLILASELFDQVISPAAKSIQDSVPESERQAMRDADQAPTHWLSAVSYRLDSIENAEVRDWIKSVLAFRSSTSTIMNKQGKLNILGNSRGHFGASGDLFSLAPKSETTTAQNILGALPLLKGAQGNATAEDMVEYINFKFPA